MIDLFNRPFLIEILDNMCTVIICFPVYDVINFKINRSFLIKAFFYMTKNVRAKFKTKKSIF